MMFEGRTTEPWKDAGPSKRWASRSDAESQRNRMARAHGTFASVEFDSNAAVSRPGSARRSPLAARRSEQGVALIAALFLLVVLAALAVYMVTISGVQQQTPTLAADASRAWYAARSGIEYMAYQATDPSGTGCADESINLDGFTVNITCTSTTHEERGTQFQVFVLEATASRGTYGGLNFVSRTARATVTTAP